jgi:hypothetical protein
MADRETSRQGIYPYSQNFHPARCAAIVLLSSAVVRASLGSVPSLLASVSVQGGCPRWCEVVVVPVELCSIEKLWEGAGRTWSAAWLL